MLLSLLNIRRVWAVSSDQLLSEFIALVEAFGADFNSMFQVVKLVLKDLKGEEKNYLRKF